MALSKRFSSITTVAAPEGADEDEVYDDELLQRLLKRKTNYTKIAPSKLGFQVCRDDLGSSEVCDEDLTDDELDESWQDDFKSLLKKCKSKSSDMCDGNNRAVEKPLFKDRITEDAHFLNENENSKFLPSKDTAACESDHDLKIYADGNKTEYLKDSTSDYYNKGACNRKIDVDKSFVQSSNSTGSIYHTNAAAAKIYELDKAKTCSSSDKIKRNDKIVASNKIEKSNRSSISIGESKKVEKSSESSVSIGSAKDFEKSSISSVSVDASGKVEKSNRSLVPSKTGTKSERDKKKHLEVSNQVHKSRSLESQKSSENLTNYHKVNEGNRESCLKKPQSSQGSTCKNAIRELQSIKSSPSESRMDLTPTVKQKEPKKIRPLVIKQATSFPLDELLPSAAATKKQRASLDSSVNTNINQESPSSGRKRHKSELLPSHKQYSHKKFKADGERKNKLEDAYCAEDNQNKGSSYIPEDVASLLAAVDTNQSLLSFFRQKLYNETSCIMPNECEKTGYSVDSTVKPYGFYTDRNPAQDISSSKFLDNNNNSEELFHLLVKQCSALVKTEDDRSMLQSLVNLLKTESGNEFTGTGFTPELDNDRKSPPSPYRPTYTSKDVPVLFEGRTLLKGGVEPRHIPKNFLARQGKIRPTDPRSCSSSEQSIVLPLPMFAKEFWETEKVKQLRKKQWLIKDDIKEKITSGKAISTQIMKEYRHKNSATEKRDCNEATTDCSEPQKNEHGNTCKSDFERAQTKDTLNVYKGEQDLNTCVALKVLGCKNGPAVQPDDLSKSGGNRPDEDTCSDSKDRIGIPVQVIGSEILQSDLDISQIPVVTGRKTQATKQFFNKTHQCSSLVHINTEKSVPSVSCSQIGPCVGIVKPMPTNITDTCKSAESSHKAQDADTRHVSMELSSDYEEGEINYAKGKTSGTEKKYESRVRFSDKKDDTKKKSNSDKSHGIKLLKKDGTATDDCSSCKSEYSRIKADKNYWKRHKYKSEHCRGRSRYSSSSSVDSRSSDRSFERRIHHSSGSHHSRYYDDQHLERRSYDKHDSKSRYPICKQLHVGTSEKQRFSKVQQSRKVSSPKESLTHSKRKTQYDDKRRVKQNKSEILLSKESENTKFHFKRTSSPSCKISTSQSKQYVDVFSSDSNDSDVEQFSLDYKERFGKMESSDLNTGYKTNSKLNRPAQSKPLPDQFRADREFLSRMQKRFDMADKVKHEGEAGTNKQSLNDSGRK